MFYPHSKCFIPLRHGYNGFDLKFKGNSLVYFYITRHKKIKNKQKLKIKKK